MCEEEAGGERGGRQGGNGGSATAPRMRNRVAPAAEAARACRRGGARARRRHREHGEPKSCPGRGGRATRQQTASRAAARGRALGGGRGRASKSDARARAADDDAPDRAPLLREAPRNNQGAGTVRRQSPKAARASSSLGLPQRKRFEHVSARSPRTLEAISAACSEVCQRVAVVKSPEFCVVSCVCHVLLQLARNVQNGGRTSPPRGLRVRRQRRADVADAVGGRVCRARGQRARLVALERQGRARALGERGAGVYYSPSSVFLSSWTAARPS